MSRPASTSRTRRNPVPALIVLAMIPAPLLAALWRFAAARASRAAPPAAATTSTSPAGVKTLSGFLPVSGGGAIEFALLLNGTNIADQRNHRPIWNDLVAAMETYPAGPSAADLAPK